MSILFLILKIIGILLLIILILLGLLLFHPVFYQVKGNFEEDISVKARFWWLFQILRLEVSYAEENLQIRLRIFGFLKKDLSSDAEESKEGDSEDLRDIAETVTEAAVEAIEKSADAVDDIADDKSDASSESLNETAKESDHYEPEKSVSKKKNSHQKSNSRKNIKAELSSKKKKISDTKDVFGRIKKEFSDEKNKQAVSHIWKELMYLLKYLKPKYIRGKMDFSTGDPALTGQVTGALSLIPILYQYDFRVCPDFVSDDFYIRGNISLKGHIALYHAVAIFIRVIRDKNIIRLLHKIRK